MGRPHTHEQVRARATCQRCAWSTVAANAQALAAQHYDRKGHTVAVEITNRITYGANTGKRAETDRQRSML